MEYFEIFQLLISRKYVSKLYTIVSKSNEKIVIRSENVGISYEIHNDGKIIHVPSGERMQNVQVIYRHLTGYISRINLAKELLSNYAYKGCVIGKEEDTYYFEKFERTYKLCMKYNLEEVSHDHGTCDFEDFVNIILHTTKVKSARN